MIRVEDQKKGIPLGRTLPHPIFQVGWLTTKISNLLTRVNLFFIGYVVEPKIKVAQSHTNYSVSEEIYEKD